MAVWYVLIHVCLGVIGHDVFTVSNLGALYCALASAPVQGYAVYEVHRTAKPKFDAAFVGATGSEKHRTALRQYGLRLARLFVFRLSVFSLLTLAIAALMRGVEA